MKTLMTTAALAAFLAAAPALAEDAAKPVATPAPAQTQTNAATPAPAAVAQTDQQMFITQQADDSALASNWIGKTVYNAAGDNVGDVNDLVIDHDGKITAIVIGVGGFLGIGEKAVAIAFSQVQSTTDANGAVKLMVNATKDQLDAAPEFVTLASLKAKEAPVTDTNPAAPAPAPAPAN